MKKLLCILLIAALFPWPLKALTWEEIKENGQPTERISSEEMERLLGKTERPTESATLAAVGFVVSMYIYKTIIKGPKAYTFKKGKLVAYRPKGTKAVKTRTPAGEKQIVERLNSVSKKSYWTTVEGTPNQAGNFGRYEWKAEIMEQGGEKFLDRTRIKCLEVFHRAIDGEQSLVFWFEDGIWLKRPGPNDWWLVHKLKKLFP